MLAVVQRVSSARCAVGDEIVADIGKGVVVLLAVRGDDSVQDASWLAKKLVNLRIFEDQTSRLNISLLQVGAEILLIPQFTLYGDCRRGHRPSFSQAASPQVGQSLFSRVLDFLNEYPVKVAQGVFGAKMKVQLENEGPVTLILSSDRK